MLVGSVRVATPKQKLDLHRDALPQVDCNRIFTDVNSGAQAERPGRTDA